MKALYNEIDQYCCAWLSNLMDAGLITPGKIDDRSITELTADDVKGYERVHFFAGIGGWDVALNLAGWGSKPVWTGSCPCQPFSVANVWEGGGKGHEDDRHLLPDFLRLIDVCRPNVVFGEQVTNAIKHGWLDELIESLESKAYTLGAAVFPMYVVGTAHERKRLYWVADAGGTRWEGYQPIQCLPFAETTPLAVYGNPLLDAGRALAGDYSGLLPCDGLSVQLERIATKGYGNAIVPEAGAEFVRAFMEVKQDQLESKRLLAA